MAVVRGITEIPARSLEVTANYACILATGKRCDGSDPTPEDLESGYYSIMPGGAKGGKRAFPALDATGKIHGTLPKIKDLGRYSKEELQILLQDLKQGVKQRIKVTSRLGRDRAHGQRQGAEQDLIKAIEKHLQNR